MIPRIQKFILPLLMALAFIFAIVFFRGGVWAATAVMPTPIQVLRVKPAALQLAPVSGQRLIYAETSPDQGQSTLWLADPSNLAARQSLGSMEHKTGYPPKGSVSPDGKWAALLVIPPEMPESAARTSGGEIWLISTSGGQAERLISGAGFLGPWSPDSAWITYGRMLSLDNPADRRVPFKTELFRASVDGQQTELILSDDRAYSIHPLGWNPDGSRFLVAKANLDSPWTVNAVDPQSGSAVQTWTLPAAGTVRSLKLSPDASRLMIETAQDGADHLTLFDLGASGLVQAQAALASGPISDQRPVSPVFGLWSSDGQSIWLYNASSGSGSTPQVMASSGGAVQSAAAPAVSLSAGEQLLPASWSPDRSWLAWQVYPENYTRVILQPAGSSQTTRLPQSSPDNWVTLIGWVGGGS